MYSSDRSGFFPGVHDLPEDSKFSNMISVVVSHDQDFAEDGVI
ncbi:MAG TPA: hypothetical protein VMV80_01175 [Anaerolineales bacterium]|nr:hypothetical protein [Anaerolineales bacterium]